LNSTLNSTDVRPLIARPDSLLTRDTRFDRSPGMFASQPLDVAARNPRAPSKVRQLGIPVDAASFQSKLCFKMQNLGNGGY